MVVFNTSKTLTANSCLVNVFKLTYSVILVETVVDSTTE
jgi:hypothetical protein